jgi:hypothetical protein
VEHRLQEGSREQAAITEDQHARLDAAQEAPTEPLFARPAGGKDGIQDQMAAHFDQRETAHLWIRAGGWAGTEPAQEASLLWAVRHILQGPIKSGEAIAKGKSARGLGGGARKTGPPQQPAKEAHAQLLAAAQKGVLGGDVLHRQQTEQAQTGAQMQPDRAQTLLGEQMPAQQHIDHHQLREFAFALFPAVQFAEQIADHRTWEHLFQQGQGQMMRALVQFNALRYSERHTRFLSGCYQRGFSLVCQKGTFFSSYVTGIVPCGGLVPGPHGCDDLYTPWII